MDLNNRKITNHPPSRHRFSSNSATSVAELDILGVCDVKQLNGCLT